MTNNEEIMLDADCGISEEEQREILTQINSIAEKNRHFLSLAEGGVRGGKQRFKTSFKAKKKGSLFPILVNVFAVVVIAGGFFLLYSFQGKTDSQVREGTKVYNSAERTLIKEIRKETSSRIDAKENEISMMVSKLEEVDAELRDLYSNNQKLDAGQQYTETRLKSLQNEYRAALALLQDERSQILEDSRLREVNLQTQLENRTRELAAVTEQSAAAIEFALSEMETLSREQAQASAVEAQIGALFANLNSKISENKFDEASEIIKTMRAFLNTPAFQGLRSIQARKELYTQTINSFESMLEEARKNQFLQAGGIIPPPEDATDELEQQLADMQKKNDQLEREIAEKNRTLAASASQGSGMTQRVRELEESNNTLRTMYNALESSSSQKNTQIQALEREKETLTRLANSRNNTINGIRDVVQGRSIAEIPYGELAEGFARIQAVLQAAE